MSQFSVISPPPNDFRLLSAYLVGLCGEKPTQKMIKDSVLFDEYFKGILQACEMAHRSKIFPVHSAALMGQIVHPTLKFNKEGLFED